MITVKYKKTCVQVTSLEQQNEEAEITVGLALVLCGLIKLPQIIHVYKTDKENEVTVDTLTITKIEKKKTYISKKFIVGLPKGSVYGLQRLDISIQTVKKRYNASVYIDFDKYVLFGFDVQYITGKDLYLSANTQASKTLALFAKRCPDEDIGNFLILHNNTVKEFDANLHIISPCARPCSLDCGILDCFFHERNLSKRLLNIGLVTKYKRQKSIYKNRYEIVLPISIKNLPSDQSIRDLILYGFYYDSTPLEIYTYTQNDLSTPIFLPRFDYNLVPVLSEELVKSYSHLNINSVYRDIIPSSIEICDRNIEVLPYLFTNVCNKCYECSDDICPFSNLYYDIVDKFTFTYNAFTKMLFRPKRKISLEQLARICFNKWKDSYYITNGWGIGAKKWYYYPTEPHWREEEFIV